MIPLICNIIQFINIILISVIAYRAINRANKLLNVIIGTNNFIDKICEVYNNIDVKTACLIQNQLKKLLEENK